MPLAMQLKDNLGSERSDRGMSPNIWGDCPIMSIIEGTIIGRHFYDDFDGPCPNTDAGLYEGAGESPGLGYLFYGDTGVTIKAQAGVEEGVVEVAGNDADNDESVMSTGSPSFIVSDTAADAKTLWFEARVKKAAITDDACGMFVGLAWDHTSGVSVAQTVCLTDDDAALGAFSYIGFHVDQANGDAIDFVYQADGGAQTVLIAGVEVPAADTFTKLGFKYDPDAPDAKQIKVYVNNVEQSTYVTATQIAAATFPDAEPLAMVWAVKVGTAAVSKAQMDWWRIAQLG
jgi:hypothetical protein